MIPPVRTMPVVLAVVVAYRLIVQHQSKTRIALMMACPTASVVSVPPNNLETHDTVVPSPDGDNINDAEMAVQRRVSIHRAAVLWK